MFRLFARPAGAVAVNGHPLFGTQTRLRRDEAVQFRRACGVDIVVHGEGQQSLGVRKRDHAAASAAFCAVPSVAIRS